MLVAGTVTAALSEYAAKVARVPGHYDSIVLTVILVNTMTVTLVYNISLLESSILKTNIFQKNNNL